MPVLSVQPYLFFGGRCEEALEFYKEVLGAEVEWIGYHRDSPDAHPPGMLQPGFEDKVMHATVRIGQSTIMCSDGVDDQTEFDGFRLSILADTQESAQRIFDQLAEQGSVEMPLGPTFWSPAFGMVTDRFGLEWMVTVPGGPPA